MLLEKRKKVQRIVLLTAITVFIDQCRKQIYKKKQVKRFWRRSIFHDRKLYSEYYTLYLELRNGDREFHYRYLRMSKERFDHLLDMVRDKITKKNTHLRLFCLSGAKAVATRTFRRRLHHIRNKNHPI